jgi:ABC-2 type transport system ATP-binding protein
MQLEVRNINKSFGTKHVLKDVSFTVHAGRALGYLGRNGAGKTTTIRILTDIFRADSGDVLLNGQPINHNIVRLGYLPEERGLYPKAKVGEQMIYIAELRGMSRQSAKREAMLLLEELEADEYWGKKLETLSKGNQQKIQLAIAVLHNPGIVILDEPFSGLDPVNAGMLKKLIIREVERGKIVLFSSHQMPYVEEFCEHIAIINKGEIVLDGQIKQIKKTYPRNRVAIAPDGDATEYRDMLQKLDGFATIATDITAAGDEVIITMRDEKSKNHMAGWLSGLSTGFSKFEVVEPTLEEIFVEKAGADILDETGVSK